MLCEAGKKKLLTLLSSHISLWRLFCFVSGDGSHKTTLCNLSRQATPGVCEKGFLGTWGSFVRLGCCSLGSRTCTSLPPQHWNRKPGHYVSTRASSRPWELLINPKNDRGLQKAYSLTIRLSHKQNSPSDNQHMKLYTI